MPRGLQIKHVRKSGAFVNGELASGEWGLDVSGGGVWWFSRNGTTVEQLQTAPSGSTTLASLTDVNLASLAEGNLLSYDATAGKWINRTVAQAGLIPTSQKGANNGVATLGSDGKIPNAQLPALAITSVSVVADNTARDALTVQEGDVAIVTSSGETYIYDGTVWRELKTTESHTHAAGDITSGDLATARMQVNVGNALNATSSITLNNANIILEGGSI